MRRTPRTLLAAVLLPASLLLAGCSDLVGTGELDYVPGNGGVVEFDAEDREPPVELAGETTTGEQYTLEPGTVTVVNVWWSGCGPCIEEMPMLTELDAAYAGEVDFLGINIQDTSATNARAFERDRDVDYPSIYDPNGNALLAFTGRTAPRATPTTLVLDEDGVVVSLINGPVPSRTTLTDLVEDAGGPPAPPPATSAPEAQDDQGSSDG
jgi:thiol-disulfide isomerase/thioredoxin